MHFYDFYLKAWGWAGQQKKNLPAKIEQYSITEQTAVKELTTTQASTPLGVAKVNQPSRKSKGKGETVTKGGKIWQMEELKLCRYEKTNWTIIPPLSPKYRT